MRKQLTEIRILMQEAGIDWLIVPSSDYHGSEYVHDHFKCREYISGFTGSAGTLLIGAEEAFLWTDGRYFLQAAAQLEGSGFVLMKAGEPGVPKIVEYLRERLAASGGARISFDGKVVSLQDAKKYQDLPNAEIVWELDLAGRIWPERPQIRPAAIWELPPDVTGKTVEEKLAEIRAEMKKEGADKLLLTGLDEIAWTWNLRGDDVECNPVFFAFALISQEEATLYTMRDGTYEGIYDALGETGEDETLWLDGETASYALAKTAERAKILDKHTPVQFLKAVKNPAEIASTTNAHIRDGAALTNFIYWIKKQMGSLPQAGTPMSDSVDALQSDREPLTEISATKHLDTLQSDQEALTEMSATEHLDALRMAHGAFELSFPTIAGYGPNGAIIHYQATEEHDAELKPEGFFLVDSGGQYPDGTTDTTRTIALGPLTNKMKEYYTLVLKGHIDLAMARFAPKTPGRELDAAARGPLLARGLDYNHGTGHGVGHVLNVHEGPQLINKRYEGPILPGMITSDEPGIYLEGEFGVRIENELLCVEATDAAADNLGTGSSSSAGAGGDTGSGSPGAEYSFRSLTMCPYEREAILPELLTDEERRWLNEYHQTVLTFLAPLLASDVREWLAEQTAAI